MFQLVKSIMPGNIEHDLNASSKVVTLDVSHVSKPIIFVKFLQPSKILCIEVAFEFIKSLALILVT